MSQTSSDARDHGLNEKKTTPNVEGYDIRPIEVVENVDQLKRHLGNRQIQMIAVGGAIGTALFISISSGLKQGGPGSLFLAYALFAGIMAMVNNSMTEMAVFMPVSGSFIRFAGKWVDEAFGFMAGWNFFLYEAAMIPFEITALNLVLTFWRDDIPVWAVCLACVILYSVINLFAVEYYGEAEFWLSGGKLFLILLVFSFTFVTMVGGNPQRDPYGFRYWRDPGSFAEYITTASLGRFEGFLGALWSAAFTICGPEYLAMVAGETERPRIILKRAFKTVYWRFGFFFIGGALCVGIIIPYNDPALISDAGAGTANGSPYVIAMKNMGISFLPNLTNAFLALEGQAPSIFKKCTRNGIPWVCFIVAVFFSLLSFLSVGNGSAQAVTWLGDLTEAAQLINYIVMCVTYVFFHRALSVQGIDRSTLPYTGWGQPYCAYIAGISISVILVCYGYVYFLPGYWDIGSFFSCYTMVFVAPVTYSFWKVYKRTKLVRPAEADLVWDKLIIDAYEEAYGYEESFASPKDGFWSRVSNNLKMG
ncbi:General amino acid permease AGP2 [Talaromyces islandicus]|uniref:General amino acid permease AGP2 n=1 Tax=Talaromyces islandicus TaxID=28573 RepID=A0A0U1LXK5_TALIS|nr:General amino acid permease AGP2 [Talaromyces islandicus]